MASADRRGGPSRPGRRRGFTLIECLVALAMLLAVVAAALALPAAHLRVLRRSLDGSRLEQEMRSAAGLIARDLARAGLGAASAPALPSADPWLAAAPDGTSVSVDYRPAHEAELQRVGYRLNRGVIEIALPNAHWQALTDAGSVQVTALQVDTQARQRSLAGFCSRTCGAASSPCPYQLQRSLRVRIEARSTSDTSLRRGVQAVARVPNDAVVGGCPS